MLSTPAIDLSNPGGLRYKSGGFCLFLASVVFAFFTIILSSQWSISQTVQRRVPGQSPGFTSGHPRIPAPRCCWQFAQPRGSVQGQQTLRLKHVQRGRQPQQLPSLRPVSDARIPVPPLQADRRQKPFCRPLKEQRPSQALPSARQRQHHQGRLRPVDGH